MTAGPVADEAVLRRAVQVLRAMAYEHRLHILVELRRAGATPSALADALAVHPTVVSHHLRDLTHAGLVRRRRDGRHVYYHVAGEFVGVLVDEVLRHAGG
ncbi:ArsR/SmtB family transcription factor [Actinoplanes teichomyceticus]|uniref:ArsR family transcriptional regulator n=1 Tax=Actinoplanes teichomyceticus TaxID=1867 RepID=A0A561VCT9_ACTTI|nr:metalloregulator ArsR/SmtB family transcription factor [Actinoplanes teichomyceticus]TWG09435.1 ArsR family transcriptional regulator [Actinoplanes teichomyceticus]GIF17090.1 hypothetical protein Ate01nite_71220 [Actinoplanes teichomyceticus]